MKQYELSFDVEHPAILEARLQSMPETLHHEARAEHSRQVSKAVDKWIAENLKPLNSANCLRGWQLKPPEQPGGKWQLLHDTVE